ncbi:MAG: asparagine synthase (glutamine-hydrolyzing) [Gemmatimonadales bacterium]
MCGIAGFAGRFEPALLDRMSALIAHRGPDGAGQTVLATPHPGVSVGLAHRRLSIIDLSPRAAQPITPRCPACGPGAEGALVLIYNGEIYNFAELRRGLERRGHTFRSATDSEVLLHLWSQEGPALLTRLNGMFAFALVDARPAGRPEGIEPGDLFLARDPIGVKPLYVATVPDGILFGSELKAFLDVPGLSRDLDLEGLHYHLAYLWTPAPRTLLRNVAKVRPGEWLLIRNGEVARRASYYDLPYGQAPLDEPRDRIAEALRDRIAEAVRRQLVADVPVGLLLSGGLDSSAILAAMRNAHPDHHPACYSIAFPPGQAIDGSPPDLPYARRVAAWLGGELREVPMGAGIGAEFLRLLYALDEPQVDPAPFNMLRIAQRARGDGIPVLLNGTGGDDLFSGYRRHRALRSEEWWGWWPAWVRTLAARPARAAAAGGAPGLSRTGLRRAVKVLEHADLDPDRRLVAYFWWAGERLRRGLYGSRMAEATRRLDTAEPLLESLTRIPGETDPLNRMLYLEGKHFLADHNLLYADRMAMACGVEVRVPLLDLELVSFAARIPSRYKQDGKTGKAIFKRAMEPVLPREVIYRPKTGFGVPLRHWLRHELRPFLQDALSESSLAGRGLFDPGAVTRLRAADQAGRIDGSWVLFALLSVELWCRRFVDRRD